MWDDTQFEKSMKNSLKKLGQDGDVLAGKYSWSKKKLVEEVYEEIKRSEPNLSDHGPRHIKNVLENIGQLLGEEVKHYKAQELYCLGMIALFHDVGNIYGRKRHNEKIREIYARVCGHDDNHEMKMIVQAAKAHTGEASTGTKDTLSELDNNFYFLARSIRLRELAAILRIADELAEGPQRTSRFVLETMGYPETSRIYHLYASQVQVNIDREEERFALTYNIKVSKDHQVEAPQIEEVKALLEFSYKRLIKLDQERKYTKFYCDRLSPFKTTSGKFVFWFGIEDFDCDLPTIVIDDKIIPGDSAKTVVDIEPAFAPEQISSRLVERAQQRQRGQTDV